MLNNVLKVAVTLSTYAFAAAQTAQNASSTQAKSAQEPVSAAQFLLVAVGIVLGTFTLIACAHDPKRIAAENRADQTHRALIRRVSEFGPAGTTAPTRSAFAHHKHDEYKSAIGHYNQNNSSSTVRCRR